MYEFHEHKIRANTYTAYVIIAHILTAIFVVFCFYYFQLITALAICMALMLAGLFAAMTQAYVEIQVAALGRKSWVDLFVLEKIVEQLFWMVRKTDEEVDVSKIIAETKMEALKTITQEDIVDKMKVKMSGGRTENTVYQTFSLLLIYSIIYFGGLAAIGLYLRGDLRGVIQGIR